MARDDWVKLAVDFFRHPKVIAAGRGPRLLHLAAMCWCGANETDGHIPRRALRVIAAEADAPTTGSRRLVEVGLWEATNDGWQIHDFTDWQLSHNLREEQRTNARRRAQRARKSRVSHSEHTAYATRESQRTYGDSSLAESEVEISNPLSPTGRDVPRQPLDDERNYQSKDDEKPTATSTSLLEDSTDELVAAAVEILGRRDLARQEDAGRRIKNRQSYLTRCVANRAKNRGELWAIALANPRWNATEIADAYEAKTGQTTHPQTGPVPLSQFTGHDFPEVEADAHKRAEAARALLSPRPVVPIPPVTQRGDDEPAESEADWMPDDETDPF